MRRTKLRVVDEPLPGVKLLAPKVIEDGRGFFMESYNRRDLAGLGIVHQFVQDNHSRSARGVLRGLHYQLGRPQAHTAAAEQRPEELFPRRVEAEARGRRDHRDAVQ